VTLRFGLVGTGPWARMTHGPGLAAADGVDLVGVWGRDHERAEDLASNLDVTPYDDYEALLADVDAVAFAVPPDVQAELALTAARAGKHLLLDKPVALDAAAAARLRDAAEEAGVRSVVFFTDRFVPTSREWFDRARTSSGWRGGWLRWFSALQEPDNPFGASVWRHRYGALWDTGPHALSTLSGALGPVDSVSGVAGGGDLVTLVLHHESGATSTASLTQFAPPAAAGFEAAVWGDEGILPMPPRPQDTALRQLLTTAAEELVHAVRSGEPHPLDVAFGARNVELLAQAQSQLDAEPNP
jgi:predicted dehydrogenase